MEEVVALAGEIARDAGTPVSTLTLAQLRRECLTHEQRAWIRRERFRLVTGVRIKRDVDKLVDQLGVELGHTWPLVLAFVGADYFDVDLRLQ